MKAHVTPSNARELIAHISQEKNNVMTELCVQICKYIQLQIRTAAPMHTTTIVELRVTMVRWIIKQLCAIISWRVTRQGLRDTNQENLHLTSSMPMNGKHATSQQHN